MNQSRWCWCPQPERTDSDNKCNKCGKLMRTSLMYDVGLGLANQQAHGRIIHDEERVQDFTHKPQYVFSTSRWYRLGKWFGWMVSLPFIGLSGLILMIAGLLLLETIPEVALILFIIGGGIAFGISQTKD